MSVARFYREAGQVIDSALAKEGSVKNLCLSSKCRRKKKLYAIVHQTLTHRREIEAVLEEASWTKLEPDMTQGLSWVLVHDLLFGPGVQCGGQLKETFTAHQTCLEEAYASVKESSPSLAPVARVAIPRHARINTILTNHAEVLDVLRDEGYAIVDKRKSTEESPRSAGEATPSCSVGNAIRPEQCVLDPHLDNVIAFAPGTDLHAHHLYTSGHMILQQKSSCMSAAELSPPAGATVIDACAAPGNKTTHLASLMNNTGRIFAFDIDRNRLTVLKETCLRAGATCVHPKLQNFLKTDVTAKEFQAVSHILVDPSCSGSGMVDRLDHLLHDSNEDASVLENRLAKLSSFQQQAVCHALSFPSVMDVVYSTCSIHAQENEDVVTAVLRKHPDWHLVKVLPQWPRRGLDSYDCGPLCVRVLPEDGTSGFFLAHFQRCAPSVTDTPLQVEEAVDSSMQLSANGKDRSTNGTSNASGKLWKPSLASSTGPSNSNCRQKSISAKNLQERPPLSKDKSSKRQKVTKRRIRRKPVTS
ncbi:28S rRNA (cytosine-C(5))-methyltransferase-like [Sycon ciliatum]|uniref:28S rRNA (cytosine-C(5))-methyltransferase-like n=1 Tax=Sycon ciliatum TaxID=27933 RepID=UPI0020AB8C34|eukprot:scpid54422/ scgid17336/ Putative methyltransferase NSUN5; NOL1-related protein; NOL1/NOP2/Sun domain family member 5; Williams-Beuren syndrome chromosomal region 20A protein